MSALETVTETKWDLRVSLWQKKKKNGFHVWEMFWQHFSNFGLTSAQVLVNEFS